MNEPQHSKIPIAFAQTIMAQVAVAMTTIIISASRQTDSRAEQVRRRSVRKLEGVDANVVVTVCADRRQVVEQLTDVVAPLIHRAPTGPGNPAHRIEHYRLQPRQPVLSEPDFALFGDVPLQAERDGTEDPYAIAALPLATCR